MLFSPQDYVASLSPPVFCSFCVFPSYF
jgi:hypothetical protein